MRRQQVYPVEAPVQDDMAYDQPYPPKYVMLAENHGSIRPPPHHRNVPKYESRKSGGKNLCLKCICCCYCLLFLIILVIVLLGFYFYTIIQPQVPSYKVEEFTTTSFDVQPDFSVFAQFLVTVKADNPNSQIGFIYGKNSSVDVIYQNATLCSGPIPSFQQGPNNVTMIKITLKGKSEFGSGLQEALSDNQKSGKIPMVIKVKVPVSIVIEEFPFNEVKVLVTCNLVVSSLSPNKKTEILSNVCNPEVEF